MATVCCPTNYIFVDEGGEYKDPFSGNIYTVTNTNYSSPTFADVINHCCLLNKGFVTATGNDIPCPCCPDNYTYDTGRNLCVSASGQYTSTIPCLNCDCTPPPSFTCTVCGPAAIPTSFTFDFTQKYCDQACESNQCQVPECGEAAFIPSLFYNPNPFFKLKNKNLL